MLFSPHLRKKTNELTILINGTPIKQVASCRFLGVVVDDKFSWKGHVSHIMSKISKTVGIIAKGRKLFGLSTLKTLYSSFIYPYLLYNAIIWGNAAKSTLKPLLTLQKRAIRLVHNLKRLDSTKETFKNNKYLYVDELYTYMVCIFMYQYTQKKLPPLFDDYFKKNSLTHSHETRQANFYHVPIFKSTIGTKSIRKTGINIWEDVHTYALYDSIEIFKYCVVSWLADRRPSV